MCFFRARARVCVCVPVCLCTYYQSFRKMEKLQKRMVDAIDALNLLLAHEVKERVPTTM